MPNNAPTLPGQNLPSTVFDVHAIAGRLPATADTMIVDTRLIDAPAASARIFRIYTPVPRHYHATCDEYLLVLSGRAKLVIGDAPSFEAAPGQLIHFAQATSHAVPAILEEPFTVLAIDTPRRDPGDIIFINPQDGTPSTFIQSKALY